MPDKLELVSIPKHEPSSQTVRFEFWNDNKKQAASLKLPAMSSDEAMCFFNANWSAIAGMASRTAPMNGEIKLTLCS
jgi:hypothetical protein